MITTKKRYYLALFLAVFACIVVLPGRSFAHRMMVDCLVENGTVVVSAFFPDGRAARKVKVEVFKPDNTLYTSGTTDENGEFTFKAGNETNLKVVATGALGHRAVQQVDLKEQAPPAVGNSEKDTPATTAPKHCAPFPFRAVFAGFGYIFGAAGILMYIKARSDLRKARNTGS